MRGRRARGLAAAGIGRREDEPERAPGARGGGRRAGRGARFVRARPPRPLHTRAAPRRPARGSRPRSLTARRSRAVRAARDVRPAAHRRFPAAPRRPSGGRAGRGRAGAVRERGERWGGEEGRRARSAAGAAPRRARFDAPPSRHHPSLRPPHPATFRGRGAGAWRRRVRRPGRVGRRGRHRRRPRLHLVQRRAARCGEGEGAESWRLVVARRGARAPR